MSRLRLLGYRPGIIALALVGGLAHLFLSAAAGEADRAPAPASATTVLGPVHDVAAIADFGTDPVGAWTAACGQNVQYTLTIGRKAPGIAEPVLAALVTRKDPRDREGSHGWFTLTRKDISLTALPLDIDGFRIVLGSATEAQWWISPTFTTDKGESFSLVLDANAFPARKLVEWVIPLDRFRSPKNEALTREKAQTIRAISFATSSPGAALLFDRITAYRRDRLPGWLDFSTSHPTNGLFQRTDPVGMAFTLGGKPPATATGFRYEVRGFDEKVKARGNARLMGESHYSFPAATFAPGYYEVTAYWTDAAGNDLLAYSCIHAEGTVPDGLGTFAVLPHTIAENVARSGMLGEKAFFGLHGDFLDLGDYVGLTWRFGYTGWVYEEPTKPDRSSGTAPWVQAALSLPAKPPSQPHILPLNLNNGVPGWAKKDPDKAPGLNWDDALAMVRDSVDVEKHLYPHMAHRLYGGLWEVDLNEALYGPQKPPYSPADIVDAYRRIHEVVKSEDPEGMVIGPCSSVIRPGWFEDVFKAGVLDWVEGIETHAYCEGSLTPEADDLPGRIRELNSLIRKYHGGKTLPIYVTEAGQPGILGADVVYRSQAERMVRTCVILKGEGVRVFLPFYGIDFDRSGYWGFLFNLDVDSPSGPWSTRRTSPKPMVNAVAACVDMLEGAEPRGQIRTPGAGLWEYAFQRGGETIIAAWAPGGPRDTALPTTASTVEIVDMMGRRSRVTTKDHTLRLTLGEAPVYVVTREK